MSEYIGKDWFNFKWVQYIGLEVEGSRKLRNSRRYEFKEQDLPLSEIVRRCYNSFIEDMPYENYPIEAIALKLIPRNTPTDGNSILIQLEKGMTESEYVLQLIKVIDEIDLKITQFMLFTDTEKVIKSTSRKPIKGTTRQNVLMRDNYTCQICGATVKDGAKLEIDHIIPYSKGGTNDESNLQVLCQECNREKHNRSDLLHDKQKLAELKGV